MVARKKYRIIFIIILLLIWEIVNKLGIYNPALLPSLESIASAFISDILSGKLILSVFNSFIVIIKAFLISLGLCIFLLSVSKISEIIDELIDFSVSIAHPIPAVAILPLVIMWFGVGESAINFVVIHSMLWPMLLNIKNRAKELEHYYKKLSISFNFSRPYEILHVYLMGSIPGIISGSKIAWSRGWRGFISAEMIFGVVGANSGLGWYLFEQRVYMNASSLYAGILAIVICGIVIENLVFVKLEEKSLLRWSR